MIPGATTPGPSADDATVEAWRQGRRDELTSRRAVFSEPAFRELSKAVVRQIEMALDGLWGRRFGLYWPRPREVALFPLARRILDAGGVAALRAPSLGGEVMRFRAWIPGDPLAASDAGLSFPRDGPLVIPDVVFVPLVGFDAENFRLGYGGGSYDRLLARQPRPHTIGVGFEFMHLDTVRPLRHQAPLDLVVTEGGARRAARHDTTAAPPLRP